MLVLQTSCSLETQKVALDNLLQYEAETEKHRLQETMEKSTVRLSVPPLSQQPIYTRNEVPQNSYFLSILLPSSRVTSITPFFH